MGRYFVTGTSLNPRAGARDAGLILFSDEKCTQEIGTATQSGSTTPDGRILYILTHPVLNMEQKWVLSGKELVPWTPVID